MKDHDAKAKGNGGDASAGAEAVKADECPAPHAAEAPAKAEGGEWKPALNEVSVLTEMEKRRQEPENQVRALIKEGGCHRPRTRHRYCRRC